MDLDLKSRTAVVTGASIGIGRAIAKGVALEGVRVVAVARRKDLLEQLVEEVQAEGGAAVISVAQDIMQEDAAKKLAATARGKPHRSHLPQPSNLTNSGRSLPTLLTPTAAAAGNALRASRGCTRQTGGTA